MHMGRVTTHLFQRLGLEAHLRCHRVQIIEVRESLLIRPADWVGLQVRRAPVDMVAIFSGSRHMKEIVHGVSGTRC